MRSFFIIERFALEFGGTLRFYEVPEKQQNPCISNIHVVLPHESFTAAKPYRRKA